MDAARTPKSDTKLLVARPAKVLVVEDDADYALLVSERLSEDGSLAPEVVSTAREARTREFAAYGAIVLDYNLPDGSGMELLKEIVGSSETPAVMLTGRNVVETAVEALRAGAFTYLVKSTDNLDVLPEVVGQAVLEAARRKRRREMAERVRRAEKLASLGTLSAGLSHEMNNPLAGIMGYLDLWRAGIETDPAKVMSVVGQSARRLRDVVLAVQAFAGSGDLPMEDVDLTGLVRERIQDEAVELVKADAGVVVEVPSAPVTVAGSWPALGQVLGQLLRNARQAVERSPRRIVTVRVKVVGRTARIEVEDTGPGLTPEAEKRLFDPFFTTRDPGKGMGMGLAISHRIMEKHGGSIRYERGASGGALFVVELPLAQVQTSPSP